MARKKKVIREFVAKKSKWEICPDCKLHIRANGSTPEERLEAHKSGYHHKVKSGGLRPTW